MLRVSQHERKNINNINSHSVRPERAVEGLLGVFQQLVKDHAAGRNFTNCCGLKQPSRYCVSCRSDPAARLEAAWIKSDAHAQKMIKIDNRLE